MCKIADAIVLLLFGLCSISDWKKKTIPIFLLVIMSVMVVCFALMCNNISLWTRLGGALIGILLFVISKCTGEAIGYGDSWLVLLLGVHIGFLSVLNVLFIASVLAGIASLFCLWKCHWKRNATLPFVPFLTIAYLGGVVCMNKKVKGSFTIEAAVIVPVILFIFGVLMHILFYWHDKNILMSTAHETAALGSGRSEMAELELEYYFFSRIEGKLLLFDRVECTTYITEDEVTVVVDGSKGSMITKAEYSVERTEPEKYIRNIRKIEKLGEGMVD